MPPDDSACTPDFNEELDRLMRGAVPGEFSFFGRQKEQVPPPLTGIEPGRVIDDFKLIAPIGQGGMGQVWEAEQISLNRRVALKLVRPDRVNEHTLDLFSREARAGGRLSHPGIVTVYGHGEAEGVAWISMELVEGAWTLKDFIAETSRKGELPDGYYRRVAELVAELADALQAAHEANVIHRDLKPANVLITPDEHPKVTDFGLAKITDETALSVTGDFAGTYAYMSPEQVAAKRAGLDHRTDVFSLGIVLYEMLTLRRPFEGDTSQQVAHQILVEEAPSPRKLRSRIPLDLGIITGKCLEKNRDRRYQTMGELAADIRRHLANQPIEAKPPTAIQRVSKWARRHPTQSVVGGVVLLALGIVTALSVALAAEVASGKRLAALQDLDELLTDAGALWPAHPEEVPKMRAWLKRAQELLEVLPQHRAELASRESSRKGTDRWWRDNMLRLVSGLEALSDPATGLAGHGIHPDDGWSVRRRLEFASQLASAFEPGGEYGVRWRASSSGIARAYPDLDLSPQMGLVPIGPDPSSGLWEFWHVATGAEPVRGEDGKLVLTEETGVVLVLIPAGSFWMGASAAPDAERNHDPQARSNEGPVHEVELSAYLLSKYELTQGQWSRFTGLNPSYHHPPGGLAPSLLHPLEQVSWLDAMRELPRMGLALPSEAQWENGCRAGTGTPWWTGAEHESLREESAANLADQAAARTGETWAAIQDWPDLDDGFVVHAPVGTYAANTWGLHEVHGNVWEWCLDAYDPGFYGRSERTDPWAAREGAIRRVNRGGSYDGPPAYARSSARSLDMPSFADRDLGIRPARAITE